MLVRIAGVGIRFPRLVLAATLALLVVGGVVGVTLSDHLTPGGFDDPRAESSRAVTTLGDDFRAGTPNLVLEVDGPGGVDGVTTAAEGRRLVDALRQQPFVGRIDSYWTAPPWASGALRSEDGARGLVVASVDGDDDVAPRRSAEIADVVTARTPSDVTVRAGGQGPAYDEATTRISDDLLVAEAVAVPLTAIALVVVFGSLLAALVPLAVGLVAMIGTLALLRGLTLFTEVSIYALNLTTALGLALAIDYSLLIVSRYREQVRTGMDREDALRHAIATAGRTVLFSAVTVALSLAALLIFPMAFLRSFGYAGIAVVALALVGALLVLPALLTVLGRRIDAFDVRRPLRRLVGRRDPTTVDVEHGAWYRIAAAVMRRPVIVGLAATALLLVLASPFLGVRFGYPDDRVLPPGSPVHAVGDSLRGGYDSNAAATLTVVLPGTPTGTDDYAARLSTVDGVTGVAAPGGTFLDGRRVAPGDPAMSTRDGSYLLVRSDVEPMSQAGGRVVADVRAEPAPGDALVAGQAAENADSVAAIGDRLPWALGWIALATFAVLFLFTGSLLLPLKALVLNVLSLSATFGAMVWIFQDGNLISLYGSTATGYLVATMPVLMFCLAFGTSMDYEVFLLARIREHWLGSARRSADNQRAVALGIATTGRIVTAAAVLMAIVFAAIATSSVSMMQMFGTGLALAVIVDATVVRVLLVPAFMRLAGRANWWAPGPLARWHARHGWTEGPAAEPVDETVRRDPTATRSAR